MISCCMISWNEAQTIDLSLKSLVGFVDEVVIADNGSFDGTQQIARDCLERTGLKGEVVDVDAMTLGQSRLASWRKCRGDWILLIDSNLVLSDAVKMELREVQKHQSKIGCVQSLNLMGDYGHYFTPLPFHSHHVTFFHRDAVTWRNDLDRPTRKQGTRRVNVKPFAVNLSRVRPAWRCWYRGEPFDPRFFKKGALDGYRTETNRQDKWVMAKKYGSIVEYVEAKSGQTLDDVKRVAPEWYLGQLNQYAERLTESYLKGLPEVIRKERKSPRYELQYRGKTISGRHPEL